MSSRKISSTITAAATATVASCVVMLGSCVVIGYYVWKKKKARSMMTTTTATTTMFRIVSLNPSTTQTLYDLGLADFVVGRTRYCPRHPDDTANDNSSSKKARRVAIPKVGGTKDVDWVKIRALEPTHILFNMEENVYTELPIAQSICNNNNTIVHTPVNIEESRDSVVELGRIFGATDRAKIIVNDIDDALHQLQESNKKKRRSSSFTYLYFIWHTPDQFLAGGATYIDAMLSAVGGINLAAQMSQERYPLLSSLSNNNNNNKPGIISSSSSTQDEPVERVVVVVADYCLLSTEPFPFKEHHIKDYKHFGHRETKIINGEMVCWHGSRMAEGLRYLDSFFS